MGTQSGCSRETAALFTEEIINLVGKRRTDRIFLVGCEHIELLVQLLHHNFTDVTCGAALAGPSAGGLAGDIFVIPAADREPQFYALLARLGRSLQPRGILLIGATASPFATRPGQIRQVLRQSGFVFVRERASPLEVHLFCCRRLRAPRSQAA